MLASVLSSFLATIPAQTGRIIVYFGCIFLPAQWPHFVYICKYSYRINRLCLVKIVIHETFYLQMQASMIGFDTCIHWHHSPICFNVTIYLLFNAMSTNSLSRTAYHFVP